MNEKNQRITYVLIVFLGLGIIADHLALEHRIDEERQACFDEVLALQQEIGVLEELLLNSSETIQTHHETIETLQSRITALEAELETIQEQLRDIKPIDDLKTKNIPAEWIDSANTVEQDLTLYTEMDPDDRITVNATAITWSQMDRSEERRVYAELDEDQHAGLVTEFGFTLDRFLNNDTTNRRIVSLWMLAETVEIGVTGNRSFIQIYAEELSGSQEEYKLVMHQRVEGPNTFVGIGPILQTNHTYYARVMLYGNYTIYQVSESPDFHDPMYESSEYLITPRTYRYQMFCVMFVNDNTQRTWSTGRLTQIKTS